MKTVIMEIKDGYAAALTEDGRFVKIKDCSYEVGMELELEEKRGRLWGNPDLHKVERISEIALSAAAVFLIAIGIKSFYTPYSTVSIDVNPSIVMSANRYDRVLEIEAVNEDAEELVSRLTSESMRYKSLETVIDAALTHISEGDYQAEDGTTYVVISANSKKTGHSEALTEEFSTISEEHSDISAMTLVADDELLERAENANTTAGKLYLVDSLKDEKGDEKFDESEWLDKPIKEIVQEIDSCEAGEGKANEENSEMIEEKAAEDIKAPEPPENTAKENDSSDPLPPKSDEGNPALDQGDNGGKENNTDSTQNERSDENTEMPPADDSVPPAPENSGQSQENMEGTPDVQMLPNGEDIPPEQNPDPGTNNMGAEEHNEGQQEPGDGNNPPPPKP